uniref:Uncharacterized protein n=1 Tax=Callorhinchus milii TaxID=7868 RepID=A0A4W3GIW4_CALMI
PPPSLPPPPPRPNRGRLAEKRTIPLPPTRLPKKELSSAFTNSEDSEESEKANGDRPPEVKQEEEIQAFTMKRRLARLLLQIDRCMLNPSLSLGIIGDGRAAGELCVGGGGGGRSGGLGVGWRGGGTVRRSVGWLPPLYPSPAYDVLVFSCDARRNW